MTPLTSSIPLPGLARQLVVQGLLDKEAASQAVQKARTEKTSLVAWLIRSRLASAKDVAYAASLEYGLSMVDIHQVEIPPLVSTLLTQEQMQRLHLIPLFQRGKHLMVGLADPTYLTNLDDVKFATGLVPEPIFVEYDKLQAYLQAEEGFSGHAANTHAGGAASSTPSSSAPKEIALDTRDLKAKSENEDPAVVEFVDKLLGHAIKAKASDIHIEVFEKNLRIRYRIDGILQVVASPPNDSAQQLISRIKVLARMDISERRVPQDGRIRFTVNEQKKIDFRVNILPTLFGEKVVMRILDSSNAALGVEKLGFDPRQQQDFMKALQKPDGMILVTGPTGSGKTVTLYTGLGILNTPEKNISTAEDPAEINMPGVNQVNVNPKVGLTFAEALRAFLRQDPDIIMVGEIRDLETAEIAIKAAQTGHLVLSTLHTNSAPETLTRLLNMGVPPFNIASSVHLIIAQRLARRLCEHCKRPADIPPEVLLGMGFQQEELSSLKVYEPVGCSECSRGYKGRVGIYQVMPISAKMGRMVMDGCNSLELAEQALAEGIYDLRRSALNKIRQGITSLAELERVTTD
ncbi:MAG TPA: type IV-A pilus assembly ATPase PilB [Candidatus Thiothrix moscowensis]|uniref:type IV-A pilus assembly ATPase PilB n=1 Tax=unclassified Thiothrix TaxID=2636184 RepID=UPI0025EF4E6B|nr:MULTISPECIES: type IV-A pilus assembly ATPase PilB [unclassified Thiothrix]HRJ54444.1 type IV-A pilus assembly ATPase PilB [Candidatus Thiothrix moscowensis]HRJ94803.1 type IV-A pilus assembly ATPase PilB [Candidatus Thiothrix moscowensis]